MDVSAPYETVVPSLDGAVLEVLARAGKPTTGRQIQRLTRRGSVPGVAAVLERLVEVGLVTAERAGSSILYEGNRDHLAWPAVKALVGIRGALFQRLNAALTGWTNLPVQAVLFGSTARGDGGTTSDVDILIIHHDSTPPDDSEADSLRSSVHRWTGNHAQMLVVSASEWEAMVAAGDPLVSSVHRDGIDLLKDPEAAP